MAKVVLPLASRWTALLHRSNWSVEDITLMQALVQRAVTADVAVLAGGAARGGADADAQAPRRQRLPLPMRWRTRGDERSVLHVACSERCFSLVSALLQLPEAAAEVLRPDPFRFSRTLN